MINLLGGSTAQRGGSRARLPDLREAMIRETSAFLTWALTSGARVPRIPRRRLAAGGFSVFLNRPGVRGHLENWWYRTLDRMGSLT